MTFLLVRASTSTSTSTSTSQLTTHSATSNQAVKHINTIKPSLHVYICISSQYIIEIKVQVPWTISVSALFSSLLSLEVIHAAWIFCLMRGGTSNSTVNAPNHTYKVPQGWDLCMWGIIQRDTTTPVSAMASRIAVDRKKDEHSHFVHFVQRASFNEYTTETQNKWLRYVIYC